MLLMACGASKDQGGAERLAAVIRPEALPMNGLPVGTMLGTENGPLLKVEGRAFWPGWERAVFLARAVSDIPEGT